MASERQPVSVFPVCPLRIFFKSEFESLLERGLFQFVTRTLQFVQQKRVFRIKRCIIGNERGEPLLVFGRYLFEFRYLPQ